MVLSLNFGTYLTQNRDLITVEKDSNGKDIHNFFFFYCTVLKRKKYLK